MTVGPRALAVELTALATVSVAICLASHRLALMSVLVPLVLAARMVCWRRLPRGERGGLSHGAELALFGLCTVLGAFNDWNSVVHHRIYDYGVPHAFPGFSTIPLWMLAYWGLILRAVATLARYRGIAPAPTPRNLVRLTQRLTWRSPALKVALQLALVLATRQLIYRNYLHPLWSWLPFAAALALYALLFRPRRSEGLLAGLFVAGGPLVEVLYIQLAGLHRYHLGWLGGVPLWIALWWVLAVLIWGDLSLRVQLLLARALPHGR